MKYTAIENKYGCIEIRKEKKYNGNIISNTILNLQYQAEQEGFYDGLNKNDLNAINKGYEIDITNNQIITDYIDANILP